MILTRRPIMTGNRHHVMLACLLVCLCVQHTAADSHTTMPAFSAATCVAIDSYFVQCACTSYEDTIGEMYGLITQINFPENATTIYDIITQVKLYEKNFTDILSTGVCRNLTDFQTCLDQYMANSTKFIDIIIKSIVDTTKVAEVLGSTFCTIAQDLRDEIPACSSDLIVGSATCTGIHLFNTLAISSDNAEMIQTALCPNLGQMTRCIEIQTFACGSNIMTAVSGMTSGLMTPACKQTAAISTPENVLHSSVVTCAIPLVAGVDAIVGPQTGNPSESPQNVVTLVTSIVEAACSRLSYLMDCVGRYMPTSVNFLDVVLHNVIDIGNVKQNKQAFSDGYCSTTAKSGIQSVVTCMMEPNNTQAAEMCATTPEFLAMVATLQNTTTLTAMDGAAIRASFCSPMKTFAACVLDAIEMKCNDTTVQSMVASSRDMLLATLRTDCGGVRQETNDVGDGASGLNVYTCLYLLLGLIAVLHNY